MKKKITVLAIIIFLGLPSVSLAGSFVVSLIQGKTPAEAVQIIAEQVDSLLGRVDTLEAKQSETSLEIERLKLENENLRLKNEGLGSEATRVAQQVAENEKSIDAVKQCEVLEKPRVCAQNGIQLANKQISSKELPLTAVFDEVISVIDKVSYLNGSWYSKPQSDEICWKFSYGNETDRCQFRIKYIQIYNEAQQSNKERASAMIKQGTEILESSQAEFDALQCVVLLKKYVPNRSAPGCG